MAFFNFLGRMAEDVGKGLISAPEYFAKTDIINPARELAAQFSGNQQALQNAQQATSNTIGANPTQALERLGGNAAQLGLTLAAPGISRAAEGAVGATGTVAKAAVSGAAVGAPFNAAAGIAQGQVSPKDLTMNFLTGGVAGGALGGIFGTAGKFINDAKAARLANIQDQSKIVKELTPDVGPVVAHDVAPAIAKTDDPHIVQNIVSGDINKKLPSPAPENPQLQNPTGVENPEAAGQGNVQNANIGAVGKNVGGLTPEEISMGKALGMSEQDVQAAKNADQLRPAPALPNPEALGRNALNNPMVGKVEIPRVQEGTPESIHSQAHLNANMVMQHERTVGQEALDTFNKLSDRDKELMKAIETNPVDKVAAQADNPQAFKQAESAIRNYYDLRHAYDTRLGIKTGYRQNYLRQILESKPIDEEVYKTTGGNLTPGYSMERLNDTQNTDVAAALERDIRGASYNHAKLAYQEGLLTGLPEGTVAPTSESLGDTQGPFQQLRTPFGNELAASKDIASQINRRAVAEAPNKGLGFYDKLNAQLKNLKLAGGGFHSLNVLGSYAGQQIASGKAFTPRGASDFGKVISSTFSKNSFNSLTKDLETKGRMLDFAASGLEHGRVGVSADVGVTSKIPGLNQIHESIFGRQIPMLKMLIADQKFDALKLDRNNPADLIKMRDISKELNQNFGGFDRNIQGLSPSTFKRAARVFLATDYNEGQIRSLTDALSKGGEAGKLARQVVFGKALLFAGLTTAGGMLGGEFQGKSPKQIAFDIMEKVANPSFNIGSEKVGLPTTQVAEVAKPIQETLSGIKSNNAMWGAQDFATARLAAIPAAAEELGANKNFYGQQVWGKDKMGRPVSGGTTAANIGSLFAPIPASQAIQTATGRQSMGAAIANTVGVRVTPKVNVQSLPVANQTVLQAAEKAGLPGNQIDAMTNFFGVLRQNSKARSKAYLTAVTDMNKGDRQGAQKAIASYNQQLIQSLAPVVKQGKYMNKVMVDQLMSNYYDPAIASGVGLITKLPSASTVRKDVIQNPQKYGLTVQ